MEIEAGKIFCFGFSVKDENCDQSINYSARFVKEKLSRMGYKYYKLCNSVEEAHIVKKFLTRECYYDQHDDPCYENTPESDMLEYLYKGYFEFAYFILIEDDISLSEVIRMICQELRLKTFDTGWRAHEISLVDRREQTYRLWFKQEC